MSASAAYRTKDQVTVYEVFAKIANSAGRGLCMEKNIWSSWLVAMFYHRLIETNLGLRLVIVAELNALIDERTAWPSQDSSLKDSFSWPLRLSRFTGHIHCPHGWMPSCANLTFSLSKPHAIIACSLLVCRCCISGFPVIMGLFL